MKTYYGNYLGLVINSSDPEYRGRIQVFIPHVMPALYDGWNKEGVDIQISCVGSNIPEGLTPEIHQKLVKILPWAEAASPIIGPSAPGNLFSDMLAGAATGAATGGVTGALVGAATAAGNHFYNQQPTSAPATADGSLSTLMTNAADYGNISANQLLNGGSTSRCAMGARQVIGAMTNNSHFKQGLSIGGSVQASSLTVGSGNNYLQKSGMYNSAQPAPSNYRNDPSQWKVGDVFCSNGGNSSGDGHVQVWTGKSWVSDFTQKGIGGVGSGYGNFTVVRMNENGIKAVEAMASKNGLTFGESSLPPSSTNTEKPATSSEPSSPNPLANPNGTIGDPKVPQSTGGMVAGPPGTGAPAGTVSGGGTVSETGISKEALEYAMRMAASESGAGVLSSGEVMKNITDPDLMLGYSYNSYAKKAGAPTVSWNGVKRTNDDVRQLGRQARALPGFNPNSMDLGYTQHNLNDAAAYGLKNSGSYKDQVLSVARHVQNQANKKPDFAAALQNASKDGTFSKAEEMNAIPGWNINTKNVGSDRYNEYMRKKGVLSERIDSKFGGDPFAALEAIDKENPATPTANEMLGTNYAAPAAGTGQGYAGTGAPSVVNNTDGYGRTPMMNNNDMASGLFAYPNPGAMVWVFFREGNPLYPVYFAASYSSKEWTSAYRGGSQGTGYHNDGKNISTGTRFSLGPQGGIWSHFDTNLEDTTGTEEKASMMLYHKGGSNLTFDNGIDFYHSHYARRDEVEQDRFIVTKGYKEEWVEGDSSTNVRGDLYVKVGKIDQETMDALQELAKISAETNKQLTQSS
jgi:hypothetical protein